MCTLSIATPEETPVKAVEQQKQPKVEEQPQPKAQPEAKTPVNEPQQQAEPEKTEKKAQTNSLEAAREATQNGDYKKAFDIYKSLANAGNAEAQYCLGIMYETGKGVDIDIFEAVMWYRKAKAKGFSMAERKLLLYHIAEPVWNFTEQKRNVEVIPRYRCDIEVKDSANSHNYAGAETKQLPLLRVGERY